MAYIRAAALYISYFGLAEPLVQTQVLPYLRELNKSGIAFTLLTFEPATAKWTPAAIAQAEASLARDGITWVRRRYHKRPSLPATMWDVLAGAATAIGLVKRRGIRIIHARSHVASMMGAVARFFAGAKLLFDIRGLLAEEYVAGGIWPDGGIAFRMTKRVERWLIRRADGFVVLTRRAREHLFPGGTEGCPIEVIPTCADVERFAAAASSRSVVRSELGLHDDDRVFVCLGSLGTWYRTSEMADFLALAFQSDPRTVILCVTPSAPEWITAELLRRGVPAQRLHVRSVPPEDVPRFLAAGDVGVSFSQGGLARIGSSPTKIAEYLASGLPVVQSAGIGDVDDLIEPRGVGVLVREYSPDGYRDVLARLKTLQGDGDLTARCRAVAREELDLGTVGGPRYRRLYDRLLT